MCYIVEKVERPTNKEIVAWKCINANSTKTVWIPLCCEGRFMRGRWQKAKHEVGFNCYLSEAAAKKSGWSTSQTPIKVRIRKIQGYAGSGVVFAREIFVPKGIVPEGTEP